MEPTTLGQLFQQVKSPMFRARNILTLKDFLIMGITTWDDSRPRSMYVYSCDEKVYGYKDSNKKGYALLSTDKEVAQLKRMQDEAIISAIEKTYDATRRQ